MYGEVLGRGLGNVTLTGIKLGKKGRGKGRKGRKGGKRRKGGKIWKRWKGGMRREG